MNERKRLTTKIFKRKSCPKWARYAAVNKSGLTYYFGWEPILGDNCWIPSPQEIKPEFSGVFDASDWKNSLIERPVTTNLDWLCKHPGELAYLLAKYDGEKDTWFAPGCKRFDSLNETDGTYSVAKARERCVKYIAKWLKQEHER